MKIFFKLASNQSPNGKWIPGYKRIIYSGPMMNQRVDYWEREFESKEEAKKYASDYCLKQGWIPTPVK